MATIATILAKVKQTVKDTANRFTDPEKTKFIEEAIRQYSRDRPLFRDALLTGDGTTKEFAVPAGWEDGFSVLRDGVEVPIDEVPRVMLDLRETLLLVQKANVEKIQTTTLQLQLAEQARIFYIIPHTIVDPLTLPEQDQDALANLAGSKLANALGAFYAESDDPTILVDSVASLAKALEFREQAEVLKKEYNEHISGGEIETPVLVHHDIDIDLAWGRDYLLHSRRHR